MSLGGSFLEESQHCSKTGCICAPISEDNVPVCSDSVCHRKFLVQSLRIHCRDVEELKLNRIDPLITNSTDHHARAQEINKQRRIGIVQRHVWKEDELYHKSTRDQFHEGINKATTSIQFTPPTLPTTRFPAIFMNPFLVQLSPQIYEIYQHPCQLQHPTVSTRNSRCVLYNLHFQLRRVSQHSWDREQRR